MNLANEEKPEKVERSPDGALTLYQGEQSDAERLQDWHERKGVE